jgi:exodeoxyribonuclease III
MKIISWNVNGIRAAINKGFIDFVNTEDPDIICIQETKARPKQVDMYLEKHKHQYWNSAEKKGYSGTAIFSKTKPLNVTNDLGIKKHDREGRVITAEYKEFFLVNVYTPNSKRGLLRLDDRQVWDKLFLEHLKKLEKTKPVVLCGDLNVAHNDIDLKNPNSNRNKTAGFTDAERLGMTNYLNNGFVDTFRHFYPDKVQYSWWSYMFQARTKGIGWRIDYFIVSKSLIENVKDSVILDQVLGSDHCPVKIVLKK